MIYFADLWYFEWEWEFSGGMEAIIHTSNFNQKPPQVEVSPPTMEAVYN
jgi:hypothetical protein